MKNIYLISLLFFAVTFSSCNIQPKQHKTISVKKVKVNEYQTKDSITQQINYWYVIGEILPDDLPTYYYSSSSPVSDFKSVVWTSGKPVGLKTEEAVATEEINETDLSQDVQSVVESNSQEMGLEETTVDAPDVDVPDTDIDTPDFDID